MKNKILLGLAIGAAVAWMKTEKGQQFCNDLTDVFGKGCEMLASVLKEASEIKEKMGNTGVNKT